eukprot:5844172-Amphidinium_carterae.1
MPRRVRFPNPNVAQHFLLDCNHKPKEDIFLLWGITSFRTFTQCLARILTCGVKGASDSQRQSVTRSQGGTTHTNLD